MSSINCIVKRLRENRILRERAEYDDMTLNKVISLCQEGDQLAIEYLLHEYEPLLKSLSSKYIMDTQDADDIRQITSIGFWEAIMSWDPDRNEEKGFSSHVKRIVTRKLTDALRKDSTEKAKLNTLANSIEDTVSDDGEGGELTIGDTLASQDASPEEQYLGKAGAKELMDFMRDKFSQAERDVIMRYIRGYKVSEIAEETGMKYKSVENALMRVKNKLADYLRTRESKKIRESKSVEFSDEEKQILESVITKINEQESAVYSPYDQSDRDNSDYNREEKSREKSHPYVGKRVRWSEDHRSYRVTGAYDDNRGTTVRCGNITMRPGEYKLIEEDIHTQRTKKKCPECNSILTDAGVCPKCGMDEIESSYTKSN